MKNTKTRALISALLLAGLGLIIFQRSQSAAQAQGRSVTGRTVDTATLQGEAALTQLKKDGQYDSLQAAMRQARYTVQRAVNTPLRRAAWHAPNPAQGYDGYVTEDGVNIMVNKASYVSLTLRGIGYGYGLQYVGAGEVSGDKQTIRIERGGKLKEWYVNGEGGLEQGFTLLEPPSGSKRHKLKLRLALDLNEGWRAVAHEDGQRVTLLGQAEGEAVNYGKLVVWDANGSPVTAKLLVEDERVIIEVNDADAVYPLTIDPTFALQQKVTAGDGAGSDLFGTSVALNGETAVIGARGDDIGTQVDQGSAYVFVRTGATWAQQAKLTVPANFLPSNLGAPIEFGSSVALSNETVVVGAPGADIAHPFLANNVNLDQGIAYVFVRSGATWIWQSSLALPRTGLGPYGAAGDRLGDSIALDGNTAVVGVPRRDNGANTDQGAAVVFIRTGTSWSRQQQLLASDGAANDHFGVSVALNGNTVIAGASGDDNSRGSAYAFTRSGVTWTQQQKLTATDGVALDFFGCSLAISGETVLIGAYNDTVTQTAQGSAYVFTRSGTVWTEQAKLTANVAAVGDGFGVSVALSGDTAIIGALFQDIPLLNQGAAYVFTRSGSAWTQQQIISTSEGVAHDNFGVSVAISGETVVVGAWLDDLGANPDQGSAYFFTVPGVPTLAQAKLTAADGAANDSFGYRVAISGDTVVVGAGQGSAYVFTRSGTTWTQQQKLTAAGVGFGTSVGISGNTIVVGASSDTVGANTNQGSAYVFTRSGTTWTQQQKLTAADGAVNDVFGESVAISGDTVVVGALRDDMGANTDQGSAYVFIRSGTTWTQQQKLTAADGAAEDYFGESVAISGETVVVGALFNDVGANTNQGSAYVFTRSGTTWTQQQKLTAADGAVANYFGQSVAISGDSIVAGIRESAYVFTRSGASWTQQQKLTAPIGVVNSEFGSRLGISGDTVVVSAILDDVGANSRQGAAYVFTRSGTIWTQRQKLTAADGATDDYFGYSVAISANTVVVSTPVDDVGANADQGSAYVFDVCFNYNLSPANVNVTAGGGNGGFNVQCGGTCPWTATTVTPWLTITNASGTGNGTVSYLVAANPSNLPRSGSISVGGSSYRITQAGSCPAVTVTSSNILPGGVVGTAYSHTLTASGGTAPHSWQMINGATLPLGLSLSSSGVLSGTPTAVTAQTAFQVVAIDANGCVSLSKYLYVMVHACGVTLPVTAQSVSAAGGAFSFTVNAAIGCSRLALKDVSWITITSGGNGTGNGTIGYTVAANTSGLARTGKIVVNNRVFTVTQNP